MKRPEKAVVLVAGFGTRLHPFTRDCPKALVPLQGKPVLAHTLERLAAWGVREVAVNVHTLADQMVAALPEITPAGLKVVISFEPELLGTGGGLRRLAWFFGAGPVWICNADIQADLDPAPLLNTFARTSPLACLWLISGKGPQTVETGSSGEITSFRGKGSTFSGLHLVSPRLLDVLPAEEMFCSVIPAYERAIAEGERVVGVEIPGSQWADIGTPGQLLEANGESVVFPGAGIGPGVTLRDAVVGPGVTLKGRRTVSGFLVSPRHGLTEDERRWFPKVGGVEPLPVRGSDRSYKRLHTPAGSLVLSVSGEQRPENFRMAAHTRFLQRNGIRVPRLDQVRQQGRVLAMEDVGRVHLLDRLNTGSAARNRSDMEKVLQLTADLHRLSPPRNLEPPFTPALVRWEHELFLEHFLKQMDPKAETDVLLAAFARVGRRFLRQPRVLVHRDLQSTNLMWKRHQPVLIDFQGMRKGPASYDLGSLLADPYLNRPPELQLELLESYNQMAEAPVSLQAYRDGVTQRMCQALGAYGRLGALPGTAGFLRHIPAAVQQLLNWTEEAVLREWAEDFSDRHRHHNPVGGGL